MCGTEAGLPSAILFRAFTPSHFLSLSLSLLSGTLLRPSLGCGDARDDIVERVVHYPNALYLWGTEAPGWRSVGRTPSDAEEGVAY